MLGQNILYMICYCYEGGCQIRPLTPRRNHEGGFRVVPFSPIQYLVKRVKTWEDKAASGASVLSKRVDAGGLGGCKQSAEAPKSRAVRCRVAVNAPGAVAEPEMLAPVASQTEVHAVDKPGQGIGAVYVFPACPAFSLCPGEQFLT